MRIGSVVLIVWLVIGAIAGGQRNYYTSSNPNCAKAGTIAVTVLAGPLWEEHPKVLCATVNMDDVVRGKFDLDVVGSYSR